LSDADRHKLGYRADDKPQHQSEHQETFQDRRDAAKMGR
jgi:hypothetical protein